MKPIDLIVLASVSLIVYHSTTVLLIVSYFLGISSLPTFALLASPVCLLLMSVLDSTLEPYLDGRKPFEDLFH